MKLYQIDAFASKPFEGNPAAVVPLTEWLPDETLQNIAAENNLSETAYFIDKGDHYHLRWFTPLKEVRLCGHATLASAFVLFEHLGYSKEEIIFKTLGGTLKVSKSGNKLNMLFPSDQVVDANDHKAAVEAALGIAVQDLVKGTDDYLARLENTDQLYSLQPDFKAIAALDPRGLIVTCPGQDTDVASRCFFPSYGIDEDPVTGSAHTLLMPYWAGQLGKEELTFVQGGPRKGFLDCKLMDTHTQISGAGLTYLVGEILVD